MPAGEASMPQWCFHSILENPLSPGDVVTLLPGLSSFKSSGNFDVEQRQRRDGVLTVRTTHASPGPICARLIANVHRLSCHLI